MRWKNPLQDFDEMGQELSKQGAELVIVLKVFIGAAIIAVAFLLMMAFKIAMYGL